MRRGRRTAARVVSSSNLISPGYAFARRIVFDICCRAGSFSLVDDLRNEFATDGMAEAIAAHDTAALFDRMMYAFSFQGIADTIAADYIERHGTVTWTVINAEVEGTPSCPKLHSYWQFHQCGYLKNTATCNEPKHFGSCPLPRHRLRNGRLNQTAYGLFLFIRDVADGDLVAWIDSQLSQADQPSDPQRLQCMVQSLVDPLRHIHGVSDKVLMMTLACLLLGSGKPRWTETGTNMIAVDTLVHNFLHRTGILHRLNAVHPYGTACYQPHGCAEVIRSVAELIDVRTINPTFPQTFPRFVQNAIWRYCARSYFDVCNGNRIDDRQRCENGQCRLYGVCGRKPLK
jgi:hypothetical protein